MKEQKEILEAGDLLDKQGWVSNGGYARSFLWKWNQPKTWRRKTPGMAWQNAAVYTDTIRISISLADLGLAQFCLVVFEDLEKKETVRKVFASRSAMTKAIPETPDRGISQWKKGGVNVSFEASPSGVHVSCLVKDFVDRSDFRADLWFDSISDQSLNLVCPDKDRRRFHALQQRMCLPCTGTVVCQWHVWRLDHENACASLGWVRSTRPLESKVVFGQGCGQAQDKPFGLVLGTWLKPEDEVSENAIFYDGVVYKCGEVSFHIPQNPMDSWMVFASDGMLWGTFVPEMQNEDSLSYAWLNLKMQSFTGKLYGNAEVDGQRLSIASLPCTFTRCTSGF